MTAEQITELLAKMNRREKDLTLWVIGDIQTYETERRVPLKVRVREDSTREPINLRLVAQALHLKDVDIASTQVEGNDEKGKFIEFHPKPYSVKEYHAKPGKIELPGTPLDYGSLDAMLAKIRGKYGPGSGNPLADDLFGPRRPRE